MPALGTSLVVKDVNNKNLFSKELWWWNPRPPTGNPLFTREDVFGYTDWIAKLTLKQFVDLNREQIQSYCLDLWRHKEDIEAITALLGWHLRSIAGGPSKLVKSIVQEFYCRSSSDLDWMEVDELRLRENSRGVPSTPGNIPTIDGIDNKPPVSHRSTCTFSQTYAHQT